ncbi:Hypothetical predicted protein [Scomber scombrus]|uniref:Uncharacterized protein n=1 Tax=Scomber scombrus TaxID=13677 RepID=A0AAV1PG31_SCOSC
MLDRLGRAAGGKLNCSNHIYLALICVFDILSQRPDNQSTPNVGYRELSQVVHEVFGRKKLLKPPEVKAKALLWAAFNSGPLLLLLLPNLYIIPPPGDDISERRTDSSRPSGVNLLNEISAPLTRVLSLSPFARRTGMTFDLWGSVSSHRPPPSGDPPPPL